MFKQNQQNKIFLGVTSHKFVIIPACALLGVLALVSTFFISADSASNSYALDGTNVNSEVTAEINGTHYITLSAPDVAFSITPDTNDSGTTIGLDTTKVDVSVETNAIGGAELYLSTSNNTNALYKDGNVNNSSLPSINASLSTTSNPTTLDNLATNTWGYSLDNTNYSGVPTIDSPDHIASIDGVNTGSTSSGIISATIPIYYAAKVDTSIPSGSYANSVTYLAVVDGGIVTSAELTSITIDGNIVEQLQLDKTNTILVTTNLKTNTYGIPRVYYTTTDPAGYSECSNVLVSSNTDGYMTIQCETTPTTVATGLTLHIVPKGTPSSTNPSEMTGDPFCSDGTYKANTSQCEAGEWKWGSFTVELPDMLKTISTIAYMQDMTPQICGASVENETKRLIDKRDGKYYWVAKLKDGNCWMTQNLDLDLTAGQELTPDTSDVNEPWDPGITTFTSVSEGVQDDFVIAQSWDLGNYIVSEPGNVETSSCNSNSGYSGCASSFTNIEGKLAWNTDVNADKSPTELVSFDGTNYDAHFLVGNHYSFQAATAGTAPASGAAPASICPAGWRLPLRSSPDEWIDLLGAYGFGRGSNHDGVIYAAPLYFVRGGYVVSGSRLMLAGRNGGYWNNSTLSDVASAGALFFYEGVIDYGIGSSSDSGREVRCVAN